MDCVLVYSYNFRTRIVDLLFELLLVPTVDCPLNRACRYAVNPSNSLIANVPSVFTYEPVFEPLRVTSVRPYSLKPFAKDPPAIETLVTLAFYIEMINSSVFRDVLNITPVGIVMYQTMRPA